MRRVVNSREVYHLWAHQTQDEAHNSSRSVSFETDSAYSYRAKIARHVTTRTGERAVLFNSRKWSVTTAKHQSYCRQAIPQDIPIFTVPELDAGFAQPQHLANLRHYANEVAEAQGKAKRARKYGAYHTERALELQTEANAYCRFFGIAEAFDADTLRIAAEAHEVERAHIPLVEAEALYRKLKSGALARGDKAGLYTVSRVEAQAVQVGCHYITLAEIERFAMAQGWDTAPVQA